MRENLLCHTCPVPVTTGILFELRALLLPVTRLSAIVAELISFGLDHHRSRARSLQAANGELL